MDWIEHDRVRYWPREARKASDAMAAARSELERQELAIRQEDKRSNYEARLALEKAKRRLRLTEEKVRATRKWRVAVKHEAVEFLGELCKLTTYLDGELPRALAALDRMAAALDKYTATLAPRLETSGAAGPVEQAATGDWEETVASAGEHDNPD